MALQEYEEGMKKISKRIPGVTKKYKNFLNECFNKGELTSREKQLIALGASVVAHDEYSMISHTKNCLEEGCKEQEVLEAVAVAIVFTGSSAFSQAVTLIVETLSEFENNNPDSNNQSKQGNDDSNNQPSNQDSDDSNNQQSNEDNDDSNNQQSNEDNDSSNGSSNNQQSRRYKGSNKRS